MITLDPRLNAYREDLAATSLQNRVRAARYVDGEPRQVAAPSIPIRVAPRFDAPLATEALMGEILTLYDARDGWAWVQLAQDHYVGYTPLDGLSAIAEENTHRVSARLTFLYPAPDIKRPPITKLSFSCTVAPINRPEGRFFELSRGGFIFADHLVGIRECVKDFVRVAERFVGAPYLWGGKTTLGIDCSGLVQISLQAAGAPCPRDSDMQLERVGDSIDTKNLDAIQRGDLLFWKGHVAIAQSADWMIHASGQHMEVVVEPIRRAIERIGESHGPLLAIKRPSLEGLAAARQLHGAMSRGPAPRPAGPRPEQMPHPEQMERRKDPPSQPAPPPAPSPEAAESEQGAQPQSLAQPVGPAQPAQPPRPPIHGGPSLGGSSKAPLWMPASAARPAPAEPKPLVEDGDGEPHPAAMAEAEADNQEAPEEKA